MHQANLPACTEFISRVVATVDELTLAAPKENAPLLIRQRKRNKKNRILLSSKQ